MTSTLTHLAVALAGIGALAGLMASGTIPPSTGLPALLGVLGTALGATAVSITPNTPTKKDN